MIRRLKFHPRATFLTTFALTYVTLLVGCAAVQKGAIEVKSLTTQPAVQAVATAVPGGSTTLAIVGGLASLVGAFAGRFSASGTINKHKNTVAALADFAQRVRGIAADPKTRQAIDEIAGTLPPAAQSAVGAAASPIRPAAAPPGMPIPMIP